jgi:predicted unusual protein kinase regulating ubiquinone biosynthesis (AarF/ABC1/UbiB family)
VRRLTSGLVGTALAGTGAAAAGGAAWYVLAHPGRRQRLRRSGRLWRLGARRSVGYARVRLRSAAADEKTRTELNEQFVIRTAEDVARELGQMKGVVMKAGQLLSFIVEALPEEAKAALASLQADAPPMAPELAEQVLREELGRPPARMFREWDPVPVAAASIGQVHRAVLADGRDVAVKVQYPGVGDAIGADLANAEVLYQLFSAFALKSLDVRGLVDELRHRMGDELDYGKEAANQTHFARLFAGHPFIHVPSVVPELSTRRVLTSEWVGGQSWAAFEASAPSDIRSTAAEVLFRFAQRSIYCHRVFNGDPHPGNYRFHPDGRVTFLDFGLVKRWTEAETDALWPVIDPLIDGDAVRTTELMVTAGFLQPDHGLDPRQVWEYVSAPYRPYLTEEFTFTRQHVAEALSSVVDVRGPNRAVIEKLNLPPSFVILDRVVWGMSALLGRLEARNRWRGILDEYRHDGPPCTELGRLEQRWAAGQAAGSSLG